MFSARAENDDTKMIMNLVGLACSNHGSGSWLDSLAEEFIMKASAGGFTKRFKRISLNLVVQTAL